MILCSVLVVFSGTLLGRCDVAVLSGFERGTRTDESTI